MPRLRPSKTEQQNRIYRSVIEGNRRLYGLDNKYLAGQLGMSLSTFYAKLKNPEMFSNGDTRKLVEVLHITKEQWLEMGGF